MICKVCGFENNDDEKFCKQCIAPINIVSYSNFSKNDFVQTITALFTSVTDLISEVKNDKQSNLLKIYLNSFWLRPETALYCATEAFIIQKILTDIKHSTFLDLGCGNGVHTSIIKGWEFGEEFDVFDSLSINGEDIYDSPLTKKTKIKLQNKGHKISYGVDIKKNMIERASYLNTFDKLLCTKAENIPISDQKIDIVYSNVLRDFNDELLKKTLKELSRIIKKNGYLIFTTPTDEYKQHLYYHPRAERYKKNNFVDKAKDYYKLDRGRSTFCAQQIPISKWSEHLKSYGFEILETRPFAGKKMMEFWDTGLRPYTSIIVDCINQISKENKKMLKTKTIDFFHKILSKTIQDDKKSSSFAFRVIIAKKIS